MLKTLKANLPLIPRRLAVSDCDVGVFYSLHLSCLSSVPRPYVCVTKKQAISYCKWQVISFECPASGTCSLPFAVPWPRLHTRSSRDAKVLWKQEARSGDGTTESPPCSSPPVSELSSNSSYPPACAFDVQVLSLDTAHVSLYELTLERGTRLFKDVQVGSQVSISMRCVREEPLCTDLLTVRPAAAGKNLRFYFNLSIQTVLRRTAAFLRRSSPPLFPASSLLRRRGA